MKQTTNFHLNKPDTTDYYNIQDSNNNMDIIDAEIKEAQEKADQALRQAENPTKVNGHTVESNVPVDAKFTDTTYGNATTTAAGLMSSTDKVKLNGVAEGANNYTHPSSHSPSIITQDASNRFVTDTEKAAWNAKAPLVSPVFTGTPKAPSGAVDYTTLRMRNIYATTTDLTAGTTTLTSGDICLVYE
ncbi:hypothetical protein [Anaerocolumna chitinilytica]|uniref:Uncharacterized protein n=1 Tax=Anaerocolumna chitinilytica TaxID=1727145 RepID=A0A7I8DR04_9FIRM|nr:hypothetical protein [Anaerocolumna chitinilytica]BCK00854.1 hypothetical protein bsdcttw_38940 [Anaerocolumna chitinilytica]